ncbi:Fe-S cluster assembly protein SufD [Microbacterium paludicola]|uniref:Fe-S cluster assembly protein SufD n=1 Tax=Microbacterium paludicola TaxID=300019 RepID=A0A4Y9FXT2_9MICO|nr:Fe-S cluster assembly protein SufD [Microbacterium paludicola]MBF0815639.1 Fe-S cluster assembly protein SufD [Microbacterium paludicola]TFU33690.1 Fe-S cluster assembly protein SufD [Microbacterium paludicola]
MTTSTSAPETAQDTHAHVDPAAQVADTSARSGNVPVQTRSERLRSYEPADFGVPTGREVNWKHTPLNRLKPLLAPAAVNDGVTVEVTGGSEFVGVPLKIGDAPRGEFFVPEDLPAAIAWQGAAEALHVRVPREAEVAEPIVIEITGAGADRRADGHFVIEALEHSKATVVLRHAGSAQYAQNVEIIARDGANLTVVTVQQWNDDAIHAAAHQTRVDRDATVRHVVVSFGGGVVRVNPNLELSGAGSNGEMYGLAFSDAGQHLESQVYLHHKGVETVGDVLYKGALQGESARTVWIGDVLIGPDATGTDSYEANRNLVLTNGARADSIPNLEIQTGDIKGAGHASATGRFDDEQLFYLQARGISEEEARRLVVLGFLAETVQKIGVPSLEEELTALIEKELAEGADPIGAGA